MQGPSADDNVSTTSVPASPYSANRAAIRSLTLPPKPNFNIPPSPPMSPSPDTDAKVRHFLDLKRKGVHFNAKLAASSALKNPSLLPKLMESAGLSVEKDQYATTLPADLWDPNGFPIWAYKEELAKAQQQVVKRKEEERKGKEREFVASSRETSGSGPSSSRNVSAAERVMAGLERRGPRDRDRSPKRRRRSRSR